MTEGDTVLHQLLWSDGGVCFRPAILQKIKCNFRYGQFWDFSLTYPEYDFATFYFDKKIMQREFFREIAMFTSNLLLFNEFFFNIMNLSANF